MPPVRLREPAGQAQVADAEGVLKVPPLQRGVHGRVEPPPRLQQLDAPLVPQRPRTLEEPRVARVPVPVVAHCCGGGGGENRG